MIRFHLQKSVVRALLAVGVAMASLSQAAWADIPFSIVAIPDTQFYSESYPASFTAQTQWIVNNLAAQNIAFVTHLGDVVNVSNQASQWTNAINAMNVLHTPGNPSPVPYSVSVGNHDVGADGGTNFKTYFGAARYADQSWYGGSSSNQLNHYQIFSAGGYSFLHLNLETDASYNTPASAIAWAQGVLNAHPNMPTILTTHNYLGTSGRLANGNTLWNNLVNSNDQIFMVLNGHTAGEYSQVSTNTSGRQVVEMLADYQDRSSGGQGWLRQIQFDLNNNKINVFTYSPVLNQYETDANSQFSISMNFATRFAPVPPPPPPPASMTYRFQNGVNGYTGTEDTEIRANQPSQDNSNKPYLHIDAEDGGGATQALLKFNNIIGGAGGIATDRDVISAKIRLHVNPNIEYAAGSGINVHRMLVPWTETSTWNSLNAGVSLTGGEAVGRAEFVCGAGNGNENIGTGIVELDVTKSLRFFLNGAPNHGWVLAAPTGGTNGIRVDSSEGTYPGAIYPELVVQVTQQTVATRSFRQGVNGYTGTQDTYLDQAVPNSAFGNAVDLKVDAGSDNNNAASADQQALLRFDNIIGSGANQVPLGATITSAILKLNVRPNGSPTWGDGGGFTVHRMLRDWSESSTWNTLTAGVSLDNSEALATADDIAGQDVLNAVYVQQGIYYLDVTASVQAWANGATNYGWAILPLPNATNAVIFDTSETTSGIAPELVVRYAVPEPASLALLSCGGLLLLARRRRN